MLASCMLLRSCDIAKSPHPVLLIHISVSKILEASKTRFQSILGSVHPFSCFLLNFFVITGEGLPSPIVLVLKARDLNYKLYIYNYFC